MGMQGFLGKYFLDPIRYGTGYNIVNTIAYAVVLGLLILATIRLFRRIEFKLDRRFYTYFPLFIFMGSSLRVLRDYEVITSNLFKTPGIYAIVYLALVGAILLGLALEKTVRIPYHYLPILIALVVDLYSAISLLELGVDFLPLIWGVVIASFITAGVFMLLRRFEYRFIENRLNLGILFAHLFDASATYMGISFYGLTAQHVLPKTIISATHPSVMFLLKLAVILPALYYLDEMEDVLSRDVLKAIVLLLGLAPGMRDIMLIMAGS